MSPNSSSCLYYIACSAVHRGGILQSGRIIHICFQLLQSKKKFKLINLIIIRKNN